MTTEPDDRDMASFHDWTGSLTDSEPDAMHWAPPADEPVDAA